MCPWFHGEPHDPASVLSMMASSVIALLDRDAADAEQAAQLARRHGHRPGRWRRARRRLREGGRARRVEGDVAFDLLHDLVDVAVEHGDRAEALEQRQRLRARRRCPSPIRDRPPTAGYGRRRRSASKRSTAFRSSASQASCSAPRLPSPPALRLTTLTRPMKWTPFWSKAVPAGALGALAVAVEIGTARRPRR